MTKDYTKDNKGFYTNNNQGKHSMNENTKELTIKHATIIFAELKDKGYGRNITIDATDPATKKAIEEWVKANNINGGEAKIKEYTNKEGKTTLQYQFKLSEYTKIQGKDEKWGVAELGWGAVVNLTARAYEYENKFGKGISASLAGIFIVEPATDNTMSKLAE